jgi:glycosyltransferase involved in cell wall biosynthesis
MRVAFTHAYSWPLSRRGGERMLHELSRAVAGRGHSVTVFTTGSPTGRSVEDGVVFHRFRRYRTTRVHETLFALGVARALRRQGFDLVHSFGVRDAVGSILARRIGATHRHVYTDLGIPIRAWRDAQPDRRALHFVLRNVDVFTCLSAHALAVLWNDYGRAGVVTPGGVDLQQFSPGGRRNAAPTILYSGDLCEPRKHVPLLAEAVALLADREPEVRLWLTGPGDPDDVLAAVSPSAQARIDVLPMGSPRDQVDRYRQAWVTALPARAEAFGLVVLESLASGTPVVVRDDAALPELVVPGKTGVLTGAEDVGALAQALGEGLDLARDADTPERCRAEASRHSWDDGVVPIIDEVYTAAVGSGP